MVGWLGRRGGMFVPVAVLVAIGFAGGAAAEPAGVAASFAGLPLHFESNDGRYAPGVDFVSRSPHCDVFLSSTGMTMVLKDADGAARVVRAAVAGADAASRPAALEPLPGRANYLRGADASRWRRNLPLFARVRYAEVYPGVDLEYYGNQGQLEYDFVVKPGADPERIALDVAGADGVERTADGSVVLRLGDRRVVFGAPVVHQEAAGASRAVAGAYVVEGGRIGFRVGTYDREKPLVVDPVVRFSSYAGLPGPEARGVGVDGAGHMYIAGYTSSPTLELPGAHYDTTGNGETDLFVMKLDASGKNIVYATFIGGSDKDSCKAMAVDAAGCAYLTGNTKSADFPISEGGINRPHRTYDIFVTKVNAAGDGLAYSCRFGGSAMEEARGITVDSGGNCIAVGGTHSPEFPTTEGSWQPTYNDPPEATPEKAGSFVNGEDAFIAKINAAGTGFVFCTLLGGHGFEKAWAVATDDRDNIYLTGHVEANDFPLTPDSYRRKHGGGLPRSEDQYGPKDAFVAKLSADGKRLLASTYFGGAGQDVGYGIGIDEVGDVYVSGNTDSPDLPVYRAAFATYRGGKSDLFVAKFDKGLSRLVYATYVGGTGNDELSSDAFGVDEQGYAYAAGLTDSQDFPTTAGAFQPAYGGGKSDGYLVRLSPAGKLDYATLLGGSDSDKCGDLAVDGSRYAYAGGTTSSADFKLENAYPARRAGGADAFIVKLETEEASGAR